MYKIIVLILSLLCSLLLNAQEMSLEECMRYAVTNNLALSSQKIDAAIAIETYRQSKRNLMPYAEAGISGTQLFGKSVDPNTNNYVNEGSILSSSMYLSAELTLFKGFYIQNKIRYQKLQSLMSNEEVVQKQREIAFQVMNSYYDVVYYLNMLQISNEQVALSDLNLKKTQKQIELGLKAEADLLEIQAQQASEIHNRITIKNKKETALLTLKRLMNFPSNQALKIATTPQLSTTANTLSADSIFSIALTHMSLVKRAKLNIEANKKNIAISRSTLYPKLSLGGSFSSSYANSWKVLRDAGNEASGYRTVAFSDQISDNISKKIYATLTIPIFSRWANRSEIKIAKRKLQIARNKAQEAERNLQQEIAEDIQKLQALQEEGKQLIIKKKAMKIAFQIAEKKVQQGLISIPEFYSAKNQLANTQAELLRTQLQLKIKEKTMDFYLGKEIY